MKIKINCEGALDWTKEDSPNMYCIRYGLDNDPGYRDPYSSTHINAHLLLYVMKRMNAGKETQDWAIKREDWLYIRREIDKTIRTEVKGKEGENTYYYSYKDDNHKKWTQGDHREYVWRAIKQINEDILSIKDAIVFDREKKRKGYDLDIVRPGIIHFTEKARGITFDIDKAKDIEEWLAEIDQEHNKRYGYKLFDKEGQVILKICKENPEDWKNFLSPSIVLEGGKKYTDVNRCINDLPCLVLRGIAGSGKSYMLRKAADELNKYLYDAAFFIPATKADEYGGILPYIWYHYCDNIYGHVFNEREFVDLLLRSNKYNVTVLLDGLDEINDDKAKGLLLQIDHINHLFTNGDVKGPFKFRAVVSSKTHISIDLNMPVSVGFVQRLPKVEEEGYRFNIDPNLRIPLILHVLHEISEKGGISKEALGDSINYYYLFKDYNKALIHNAREQQKGGIGLSYVYQILLPYIAYTNIDSNNVISKERLEESLSNRAKNHYNKVLTDYDAYEYINKQIPTDKEAVATRLKELLVASGDTYSFFHHEIWHYYSADFVIKAAVSLEKEGNSFLLLILKSVVENTTFLKSGPHIFCGDQCLNLNPANKNKDMSFAEHLAFRALDGLCVLKNGEYEETPFAIKGISMGGETRIELTLSTLRMLIALIVNVTYDLNSKECYKLLKRKDKALISLIKWYIEAGIPEKLILVGFNALIYNTLRVNADDEYLAEVVYIYENLLKLCSTDETVYLKGVILNNISLAKRKQFLSSNTSFGLSELMAEDSFFQYRIKALDFRRENDLNLHRSYISIGDDLQKVAFNKLQNKEEDAGQYFRLSNIFLDVALGKYSGNTSDITDLGRLISTNQLYADSQLCGEKNADWESRPFSILFYKVINWLYLDEMERAASSLKDAVDSFYDTVSDDTGFNYNKMHNYGIEINSSVQKVFSCSDKLMECCNENSGLREEIVSALERLLDLWNYGHEYSKRTLNEETLMYEELKED